MTFRVIRKQVIGEFEPGENGKRFETQTLRLIADFLDEQDKQNARTVKSRSYTTHEPLSETFEAVGPGGSAVSIGMGSVAYDDNGEPLVSRTNDSAVAEEPNYS